MIWAFGKGIIMGAGMSLMLGTVFFSLIQNSIQNGWNKGVLIALGVVASDVIFITLAVIGASFMSAEEGESYWVEGAASILLLFLGVSSLLNKNTSFSQPKSNFGKVIYYLSNGFLLNILNPVNFLFWAGLAALARSSWGYSTEKLVVFFAGCIFSIFAMEVLLSYLATRIKPYINDKVLLWINRVTGLIFIGIGLKLFVDLFI